MLKIFSMFSGMGGAEFALKKAGIDFEVVGFSEIDKFAIQCYNQNHFRFKIMNPEYTKEIRNFGDCTKINPEELPDFDLLTGGFPCQSFSIAGKGLGEQDTRGTLFHEIIRIAEVKKPRYMLLENVKGLTFKKHKETFEKILIELDRIGYSVDWKILNSKEHGIPQNRERIFFICFRDSDDWEKWEGFPEKEELKIFVKDILEKEVDEKYLLSEKAIKLLRERLNTSYQSKFNPEVSNTLRTNYGNSYSNETYVVGNVNPSGNGMNGNVYSGDVSPTLTTNKGEGIKIVLPIKLTNKNMNGRRIKEDGDPTYTMGTGTGCENGVIMFKNKRLLKILENPVNKTNMTYELTGDTPSGISRQGDRIFNINSYCPTLNCTQKEYMFSHPNGLTIRKLTPKECFRLMGFLNDEINLEGLSNSQQYKIAGNGWDINLVSKIFEEMLK